MCLRHGMAEEGRQLGGEPAIRFAQILELSGKTTKWYYFNGLVASVAGRLPQPLSAADLADLWDSLWFLLMAAADGKPSKNFSPLENEWDRQDQLRWFSRDDPPPLQQPELLKWRHWRPREDQGNGAHDPASAGTSYARKMGGTAPCPLRPLCGAHRIHAGHPGGGLPQGGIGPSGGQQVPDAQATLPGLRKSPQERLHRDSMAGTSSPMGCHPVQVAAGVEHPQVVLKDLRIAEDR